jgi:phage/plasmid-associated DNA primase
VNQYRVESNPARRFLTEHYEADLNPESFVQAADVYKAYREWCGTNGYMPLGEHKFGQEVMRAFPHSDRKQRRIIGERKWCYIGIQPAA